MKDITLKNVAHKYMKMCMSFHKYVCTSQQGPTVS